MMNRRIILGTLMGVPTGAIGFSALTVAWHSIFAPELLGDGQYIFIFLGTVPAGALFGAVTGAAATVKDNPQQRRVITAFGGLVGLCTIVGLVYLRFVGMEVPRDLWKVWGHGLLWAAALPLWGWRSDHRD